MGAALCCCCQQDPVDPPDDTEEWSNDIADVLAILDADGGFAPQCAFP